MPLHLGIGFKKGFGSRCSHLYELVRIGIVIPPIVIPTKDCWYKGRGGGGGGHAKFRFKRLGLRVAPKP